MSNELPTDHELILIGSSEEKKQFNVKLHTSMIDYIDQEAKRRNTTSTNMVRHALNLTKRLSELEQAIEHLDDNYVAEIVKLEQHNDEQGYVDDKEVENIKQNYKIQGYGIRESYADILDYVPSLPDSPCPF